MTSDGGTIGGGDMEPKSRIDPMLKWRHFILSRRVKSCPFDIGGLPMDEFLHDDDGSRYFTLSGGLNEVDGFCLLYLTPAPLECPMRQAFEIGDVTWSEYWGSRPRLIFWKNSFLNESFVSTEYVSTRELCGWAQENINQWESTSPFDFKRRVLEFRIEQDVLGKCDTSKSEANYREFMKVYERRMGQRAA